jgi:uncharacterized membrane protein
MIPFSGHNIKKAVFIMRILLLNDNPVVRKLVALSAQKTKDDLNVVWSVDEIEHEQYDLLIVDDANYSDEVMSALKEKIDYKSSLLMATRGAAVPAGFDKVINKPFLPTDLVELFVAIEKSLPSAVKNQTESQEIDTKEDIEEMQESDSSIIDLDTLLDTDNALDTYDLEDLEDFEDATPLKTSVLDHEEVQELQDLLEDTEDELVLEDRTFELPDSPSMENFDDDFLALDDLMLDDLGLVENEDTLEEDFTKDDVTDEDHFDTLLSEMELNESLETPLSEDEFDDLEQQIQEAVGELDSEDLDGTLDDMDLEDLDMEGLEETLNLDSLDDLDELEGMDELDCLDERELKRAIGEELDDELEIRVGAGEHSSLDSEALNEAMGISPVLTLDDSFEEELEKSEVKSTPAEGMEALQALLKALSNDDVAKTLKGLSINININFGNDK